jgi:hypothetical protein
MGEALNLSDAEQIRRRIEVRVTQGEFLAGMLHLAARESAGAQGSFIDKLCGIAAKLRAILEANGRIAKLQYRPEAYWQSVHGKSFAFLDGGVANIDLPSAAPVGIRVGSYLVRPGEMDLSRREAFDIALSIVDDLYSNEGFLYDSDFDDVAKLRDAARIISETAAVWHLVRGGNVPDGIFLHGPLINPASPYGLDDFPAFGVKACCDLLVERRWKGSDDDREFIPLYLELLQRIKDTKKNVTGVVERSIGKDPVVLKNVLNSLQDQGVLKQEYVRSLLEDVKLYGLNDATLFDVVLEEGEYIRPIAVARQGPENKWPEYWKQWIRDYPAALTTYLKPSALVIPFRVEAFEDIPDFAAALDLIMHTSRLLPSYGFPVGLDIVDKFAKVPEWMSRGVKGQHQVVLLKKALESGDPRAVTFAKRVLAAKGRDWFFRPSA